MQVKGWNWTCRSQSLLGSPYRGTILRVRGRGTGPRTPSRGTTRRRVLPRSLRDLRRTQTHHQEKKHIFYR